MDGLLFRPFRNQRAGNVMQAKATALTPGGGALHEAVGHHRGEHGAACLAHDGSHLCVGAQRGHAKVQEWLGHANISTTRVYDRRGSKPEDSPTFRVAY